VVPGGGRDVERARVLEGSQVEFQVVQEFSFLVDRDGRPEVFLHDREVEDKGGTCFEVDLPRRKRRENITDPLGGGGVCIKCEAVGLA